ncbi:unnamed protein product [Lampetra planeri]
MGRPSCTIVDRLSAMSPGRAAGELKRAFDETYQQTCRAFTQWKRKREETISHFRRVADALDKTQRDVDNAGLVGAGAMATGALAAVGGLLAAPVMFGVSALTAGGVALGLMGGAVATGSILSKEFIENNSLDKVERTLEAERNSLNNLNQCLNELIKICDQLEIKRPQDGIIDGDKAKKLGSALNTKNVRPAKSMELLSNTILVPVFSAVSIGISTAFVIYLSDSIRNGSKSETSQRLRARAGDFEFHLEDRFPKIALRWTPTSKMKPGRP